MERDLNDIRAWLLSTKELVAILEEHMGEGTRPDISQKDDDDTTCDFLSDVVEEEVRACVRERIVPGKQSLLGALLRRSVCFQVEQELGIRASSRKVTVRNYCEVYISDEERICSEKLAPKENWDEPKVVEDGLMPKDDSSIVNECEGELDESFCSLEQIIRTVRPNAKDRQVRLVIENFSKRFRNLKRAKDAPKCALYDEFWLLENRTRCQKRGCWGGAKERKKKLARSLGQDGKISRSQRRKRRRENAMEQLVKKKLMKGR